MSWISGLSHEDLARLRASVRQIHFRYLPTGYDEREADKIIEALGPEVAERLIEKAVKEKLA